MLNFNEINYDNEKFELNKNKTHTIRKIGGKAFYNLPKGLVTLKQIDESDDFLIISSNSEDMYEKYILTRLSFSDGRFSVTFSHTFNEFEILSLDTILLDYSLVYSISENAILEKAKWLSGMKIEITDEYTDDGHIILYCEKELITKHFRESFIFYVDGETFEPASKAYSTLQKKFFNISSYIYEDFYKFDLEILERRSKKKDEALKNIKKILITQKKEV